MDIAVITAWRQLRAKHRGPVSVITTVAVLGIALGVAALCAVLAVTSGFEDAFRDKLVGINAHLMLTGGAEFFDYREVAQRVRADREVVGVSPFVAAPMMITHGDRIAAVMVKGIEPASVAQVVDLPSYLAAADRGAIRALRPAGARPPVFLASAPRVWERDTPASLDDYLRRARDAAQRPAVDVADELTNGPAPDTAARTELRPALPTGATPAYAPPPDDDAAALDLSREVRDEAEARARERTTDLPGVILGCTLAQTLEAHVGDVVHVVSPLAGADLVLVQQGPAPRARDVRVVGTFDAGFDEFDSRLAYVDLWEAQQLFGQGDVVSGLEVRVRDVARAAHVGRRLERALGGRPYQALDWQALHRNVFTALGLQKLAIALVITIIILVAAFNVVATLVMVVLDKRREIAILKAMGADERAVRRIFLLQGLAIGALGTLVGLLLGAGICGALVRWPVPLDAHVYLIRSVPVRANPGEFALTAAVALAISVTAALLPAAWAARLSPVDGLRGG